MSPRWAAIGAIAVAMLQPRPAQPEPAYDRGSDRRGVYTRIGAGPGYSSGTYRYTGMSNPGFGVPSQRLTFETPLHGAHADVAVAVGYAIAPGLAAAGSGTARVVPVPSSEWIGSTELATTVMGSLGVVIDFFPAPYEEVHFVAGAGWAVGIFAYGRNHDASPDNIVIPEAVSGAAIEGGVGYRLTPRFDLLVRGSYAWLDSPHSQYRPLGVTVLASWLDF
jgi:hypothetical protein